MSSCQNNLPTVLVVDDLPVFRLQYTQALYKSGQFAAIHQACNGVEAIEMARLHQPDLILMDIHMPLMNGIEATEKIKSFLPRVKVMMVTCLDSEAVIRDAFSLGIDAYCLKGIKLGQLLNVAQVVLSGGVWLDPGIAQYVLRTFLHHDIETNLAVSDVNVDLAYEETSIIAMIAANRSYADIALNFRLNADVFYVRLRQVLQKLSHVSGLGAMPQLFSETA